MRISIAVCAAFAFALAPASALAQEGGANASGSVSLSASGTPGEGSGSSRWIHKFTPTAGIAELGAFVGVLFPAKDHNLEDVTRTHQSFATVAPDFGLRAAYFPLSFLGGELEGALMPTHVQDQSSALLWAVRAHVIAQLPLWRITPFVLVGGGRMGETSDALGSDGDPLFEFGGGVKMAVDRVLSLRLDGRDNLTQKHAASNGTLTHHPEVLVGVSFLLGRRAPASMPPPPPPPDRDGDGVPDALDKCPDTPGVPPTGCPGDIDHDGIPDNLDKCPDTPGIAPDGCPPGDKDGDGITDDKDKCPTVPGVPPDGCPPPDRDKDGFPDAVDECPDTPGVAPHGCPDRDGDGIPDKDDKCPDKPETFNGYQDADGCPDELPKAVKKFTGVIHGIEFDTGKATIRPRSRFVLNGAVKVLKKYDSVRVMITGHTDDTGTKDFNLKLSKERADSVKDYLVAHGIDASRIETKGVGDSEPLVPNKTAKARQKNRRIEFAIIHK
jgi:outer membrane protein OmpA-like peptidoglycan-associated protein